MSINRGVDKEDVIHIQNGILLHPLLQLQPSAKSQGPKNTEFRGCCFLILGAPFHTPLLTLRDPEMLLAKDLYKVSSFWESQSRRILWDAPVFELFKETF